MAASTAPSRTASGPQRDRMRTAPHRTAPYSTGQAGHGACRTASPGALPEAP
ncbi:MAG: hypothetical protein JO345_12275 [Streptosporangiaceae bacterium]|nr:hypothetical protein [Streptosporangiaceae bacterium]